MEETILGVKLTPRPSTAPPDKLTPVHEKPGAYLAARYREFQENCERISRMMRLNFPDMADQYDFYSYVWEEAAKIGAEYQSGILGTPNVHGDVTRRDPLIKGFLQTITILTERVTDLTEQVAELTEQRNEKT